MNTQRDALEALTNLLYLIEKNAHDRSNVEAFVRQTARPLEFLIEHCGGNEDELDEAA